VLDAAKALGIGEKNIPFSYLKSHQKFKKKVGTLSNTNIIVNGKIKEQSE